MSGWIQAAMQQNIIAVPIFSEGFGTNIKVHSELQNHGKVFFPCSLKQKPAKHCPNGVLRRNRVVIFCSFFAFACLFCVRLSLRPRMVMIAWQNDAHWGKNCL